MGYGGFITWTPLIREVIKLNKKCVLYNTNKLNIVNHEVFDRIPAVVNPNQAKDPLWFNIANQNCVYLTHHGNKVIWKPEKLHMAARILKEYGFPYYDINPTLSFRKEDIITVPWKKRYIVIEPTSKTSFTPNKQYVFEKWQKVVNALYKEIDFVQVSEPHRKVLDNVISSVGKTSFMQACWIIKNAIGFVSTEGGLVHAATAVGTKAISVYTGYMPEFISAYPQNVNINISTHDEPCGLTIPCDHCRMDRENHDPEEIIQKIKEEFL